MGWQPVPKSDHKDLCIDSSITIMVLCGFCALCKEPLTMAMRDETASWNLEHSNGSLAFPQTLKQPFLFSHTLERYQWHKPFWLRIRWWGPLKAKSLTWSAWHLAVCGMPHHSSQTGPDSGYCTQKVQGCKRWLKKKPHFLIIFTYSKLILLHRNPHYVHINYTSKTKYLSWAPMLTSGVAPPSQSISIPCHK